MRVLQAVLKVLARTVPEKLERIYELTYKYQQLRMEEKFGDYGLPKILEDRAYMESARIRGDLSEVLDDIYDDLDSTFETWIDRHMASIKYQAEEGARESAYEGYRLMDFSEWLDIDAFVAFAKNYMTENTISENVEEKEIEETEDAYPGFPSYDQKMEYLEKFNSKAQVEKDQESFEFAPDDRPAHLRKEQKDYTDEDWYDLLDAQTDNTKTEIIEKFMETVGFEAWIDDEVERMIEDEDYLDAYIYSGALGAIRDFKAEELDNYLDKDFDAKITLFQKALTISHNNGEMSEHLLGGWFKHEGKSYDSISFLNMLSDGPKVDQWNKEIQKVLGYEPGSRFLPEEKFDTRLQPKRDSRITRIVSYLVAFEI